MASAAAMTCRCGPGLETPQLAQDLLLDGEYQPLFPSDVWALGLLMLDLAGGKRPAEHIRLLYSPDYLQEVQQGSKDPRNNPGQKANLTYLMHQVDGTSSRDYADQVHTY